MLNLKHGGHIIDDEAPGAAEAASKMDNVILRKDALRRGEPPPTETPFDYLLLNLVEKPDSRLPEDNPAKVVADLKALGGAMVEQDAPPEGNSIIPPVYTYWGQFIDHDLTANTDRTSDVSDITKRDLTPVPPAKVTRELHNLRRPALDLDSVYGNGPSFINPASKDAGFYKGPRFRIGMNTASGPGVRIPPVNDLDRDLPRIGTLLDAGLITEDVLPEKLRTDPTMRTRAFIGDARNDENLIIAQFHLAFLKFHNEVVTWVETKESESKRKEADVFKRARKLTRWHYQ